MSAAAAPLGELHMTPQELDQFHTQGWCIKKGVFDPVADFRPLEQVIDSVMDAAIDEQIAEGAMTEAEAYRGAPFDERLGLIQAANVAAGIAIGRDQVKRVFQYGGGQGDELLRLLRHPNLLSLVADLVGPDIIGSSVFRIRPKVPYEERSEVPLHQVRLQLSAPPGAPAPAQRQLIMSWAFAVRTAGLWLHNGALRRDPRRHGLGAASGCSCRERLPLGAAVGIQRGDHAAQDGRQGRLP